MFFSNSKRFLLLACLMAGGVLLTAAQALAQASGVTMISARNQAYVVNDGENFAANITITATAADTILPALGIQIRIPDSLDLTWVQPVQGAVTFTGTAVTAQNIDATQVPTISPDAKVVIFAVADTFAVNEQVVISGLQFRVGGSISAPTSLQASVDNGANFLVNDTAQIGIGQPSILSANVQIFVASDGTVSGANITISDHPTAGAIVSENGVRVRIPDALNMTWASPPNAGSSAGLSLGQMVLQDNNKTLFIPITESPAPQGGAQIILSNIQFSLVGPSTGVLELIVNSNRPDAHDVDDNTIAIGQPTIAMAPQVFLLSDGGTGTLPPVVVQEDAVAAVVTSQSNLRLVIPEDADMTWASPQSPQFAGSQAGRVGGSTVSGKTLTIQVTQDFTVGGDLQISGLQVSLGGVSPERSLSLLVNDVGNADAQTPGTVRTGAPTIISGGEVLVASDRSALISVTIAENSTAGGITAQSGFQVVIPNALNATWDNTSTVIHAAITGVSFSGKVVTFSLARDLATNEQVVLSGLQLIPSAGQVSRGNLELVVTPGATADATATQDIRIGQPGVSVEPAKYVSGQDPAVFPEVTITEQLVPAITASGDIRLILLGVNAEFDLNSLSGVQFGGASNRVGATPRLENNNRTLVVDVVTDFEGDDILSISNVRLSNFGAESQGDLQLVVNQIGGVDATAPGAISVGQPQLTSTPAGNRVYVVGDSSTAAPVFNVQDGTIAVITAENDIRLVIPAGLNMTWDTTQINLNINNPKVSNQVTYQPGGKVMILDVTNDLDDSETVNISGLRFRNFTAAAGAASIGLSVTNDNTPDAQDENTDRIGQPTLVSNGPVLIASDGVAPISVTIIENSVAAAITQNSGFHLIIPQNVTAVWNSASQVSNSAILNVGFVGKIATFTLNRDLAQGEQFVISGLQLVPTPGQVSSGNLQLLVTGRITDNADATDTQTIRIGQPTVNMVQAKYVSGQDSAVLPDVLITEDTVPAITASNDIRLTLVNVNAEFDPSSLSSIQFGGASNRVGSATLESGNKILVIDVISDFTGSEGLLISDIRLRSFGSESQGDLEFRGSRDGADLADDALSNIVIVGQPSISSGEEKFIVNDPPKVTGPFTIKEGSVAAVISINNDIRLIIPPELQMTWDATRTTISVSDETKISTQVLGYSQGNKVVTLDVISDFLPNDEVSVSGLAFQNFSAPSVPASIGLSVTSDNTANAQDDQSKGIGQPKLSSSQDLSIVLSDGNFDTPVITIEEHSVASSIMDVIQLVIPSNFNLTFDPGITSIQLQGSLSGSATVTYPGGTNKIAQVAIPQPPVAGALFAISGLRYRPGAVSVQARLQLVVTGSITDGADATDDKTFRIGQPTLRSSATLPLAPNSPAEPVALTISEHPLAATITINSDIRVQIPDGLNLIWDQSVQTVQGNNKINSSVNYLDTKTVLLDVIQNFTPGEVLQVRGLRLVVAGDRSDGSLSLLVNDINGVDATDEASPKKVRIPSVAIPENLILLASVVNIPEVVSAGNIEVLNDDGVVTTQRGIRLVIPASLGISWDPSVGSVQQAGLSGAVSYEAGNKIAQVAVTDSTLRSYSISGLQFLIGDNASSAQILGLSVNGTATVNTSAVSTIQVGKPSLVSNFGRDTTRVPVGINRLTLIGNLTVQEDAVAGSLIPGRRAEVRLPVPAGVDTLIEWESIGSVSGASASASITASNVLSIEVTEPLAPGIALVLNDVRVVVRSDVFQRANAIQNLLDNLPITEGLEFFVEGSNQSSGVIDNDARRQSEGRERLLLRLFIPILLEDPRIYTLNDTTRIEFRLFPNLISDEESAVSASTFPVFRNEAETDPLGAPSSFVTREMAAPEIQTNVTQVVMSLSSDQVIEMNRWYDDTQLHNKVATDVQIRISGGALAVTQKGQGAPNEPQFALINFMDLVRPETVVFSLDARYFNSQDNVGLSLQRFAGISERILEYRTQRRQDVLARTAGDLDSLSRSPPAEGLYRWEISMFRPNSDTLSFPIVRQFVVDNEAPSFPTFLNGRVIGKRVIPRPVAATGPNNVPLPVTPSDVLEAKITDNYLIRNGRLSGAQQDDALLFEFPQAPDVRIVVEDGDGGGALEEIELPLEPIFEDSEEVLPNLVLPLDRPPLSNLTAEQTFRLIITAMDPAGNTTTVGNDDEFRYTLSTTGGVASLICFPNPFSPLGWNGDQAKGRTTIRFVLTEPAAAARIKIYTAYGELVYLMEIQSPGAGEHLVPWDGRDFYQNPLSSGVYFCILEANNVQRKFKIAIANGLQ